MARLTDLKVFALKHGLLIISVADLIRYRRQKEKLVHRVLEVPLPNQSGDWKVVVYKSDTEEAENLALVKGKIESDPVLVRVHSECLTGDVFGSLRCDCGDQLHAAMDQIEEEGGGVLRVGRTACG